MIAISRASPTGCSGGSGSAPFSCHGCVGRWRRFASARRAWCGRDERVALRRRREPSGADAAPPPCRPGGGRGSAPAGPGRHGRRLHARPGRRGEPPAPARGRPDRRRGPRRQRPTRPGSCGRRPGGAAADAGASRRLRGGDHRRPGSPEPSHRGPGRPGTSALAPTCRCPSERTSAETSPPPPAGSVSLKRRRGAQEWAGPTGGKRSPPRDPRHPVGLLAGISTTHSTGASGPTPAGRAPCRRAPYGRRGWGDSP